MKTFKCALLLVLAVAATVVAQVAMAQGAITVRGVQSDAGAVTNNCSDVNALATYGMDGDLGGCWYTDTFEVKRETPSGSVIAFGTEHFIGCLNGTTCGSFKTTFTFTGKYAGLTEIHGRCHHPIIAGSGTDGFAGVSGVIEFKDIPSLHEYPYHGTIKF